MIFDDFWLFSEIIGELCVIIDWDYSRLFGDYWWLLVMFDDYWWIIGDFCW